MILGEKTQAHGPDFERKSSGKGACALIQISQWISERNINEKTHVTYCFDFALFDVNVANDRDEFRARVGDVAVSATHTAVSNHMYHHTHDVEKV